MRDASVTKTALISTNSIRITLQHLSRQKYRWKCKVITFITRSLLGRHTDLQSSIARWALRALSVLSRRSGSRSADLPMWKMLAADLGRFFRPFGAEHMHTRPRIKPPRRESLRGPFGRVRSILECGSFLSCRRLERWDRRVRDASSASPRQPSHLHPCRGPCAAGAPQRRGFSSLVKKTCTNAQE